MNIRVYYIIMTCFWGAVNLNNFYFLILLFHITTCFGLCRPSSGELYTFYGQIEFALELEVFFSVLLEYSSLTEIMFSSKNFLCFGILSESCGQIILLFFLTKKRKQTKYGPNKTLRAAHNKGFKQLFSKNYCTRCY
jgi:hypothetical protein